MSTNQPDLDDDSLPGLTQLDADAAPVDADVLDRLRDRSTREFQNAQSTDVSAPTALAGSSPEGSRTMLTTSKLVVSMTAAVMAGIAAFVGGLGDPRVSQAAPVTFADVLKNVGSADTLRLKVVQGRDETQVHVRYPGHVHWQSRNSPRQYRIASGSRLWRIDEAANSVKTGASPCFRNEQTQVDLLALLDVSAIDAEFSTRFSKAISVGQAQYNRRACRVFRMRIADSDPPLTIEAFADLKTNELYTITAWPDGPRDQATPLAELRLLARNVPVNESMFVVGKSLSHDGRIGKIVDAQGMVSLRPVIARSRVITGPVVIKGPAVIFPRASVAEANQGRWTPVCRKLLAKPGDWLRTDTRGANAVKVILTSGVELTLGPGTLIELSTPFQAMLHYGIVQAVLPPDYERDQFDLYGPNNQVAPLEPEAREDDGPDRHLLEVDQKQSLDYRKDYPPWLAGFEGATNNESLGSLIVEVDGRNVPLTVGYHNVKVEIRDQIARTTIEESFVNHTKSRLEGVFHFPLPQDASISGFGMWINGELIEADVVEKQRAREIYEIILRERRDPGLLEWTGGNIFKARVFPIEAMSEKRIRIVYTQVLPLRGNQYRYSYGLRSELLRKTPLRELSIEMFVNSDIPLKSVTCGTHSVRSDMTDHSAHVEFAAQEYTPERDFEVVCELDAQQSDVVMIPHSRGDDGYFLIQLTPPSAEGNFQREVLPDGEPLNLLLVCDTSASMDAQSRAKQTDFVTAMLTSLGSNDRFNVAVSDVDTRWLLQEPAEATEESITQIGETLDERISLGWTDLDKAFASIQEVAQPGAHVVYVGDGIVTAHDPDPQSFVTRLGVLFGDEAPATFHAVSVSSSFESAVLKAIAGVSRGSVRSISGERTPQEIALELLNEMAQPGLTDLQVQFRGVQVAAVYPEKLPNVAAGTQQILIGRYLPQGEDQSGQVIVTGKRGGESVKYAARVSLKDAEKGNSFIPRLWARMHLDQLLQQGSSQRIKDEIIAMSEEFHIITPYTSLLVLESDSDRARFGVKRRFQMRDGERFFADGRDNANYELLQQQMRQAGDWRIGLRNQVMMRLAALGRSHQAIQQLQNATLNSPAYDVSGARSSYALPSNLSAIRGSAPSNSASPTHESMLFLGRDNTDQNHLRRLSLDLLTVDESIQPNSYFAEGKPGDFHWGASAPDGDGDSTEDLGRNLFAGGFRSNNPGDDDVMAAPTTLEPNRPVRLPRHELPELFGPVPSGGTSIKRNRKADYSIAYTAKPQSAEYGGRRQPGYTGWVDQLFPTLAGPADERQPMTTKWPEQALVISRSLLRRESLRILEGGLEIRTARRMRDARWDRITGRSEELKLYSPQRWLQRPTHQGAHTVINWCDGNDRGVFSLMFHLGRVRAAVDTDRDHVVIGINDYSQRPLHESWPNHTVTIEKEKPGRVRLLIRHPQTDAVIARVTVDSERKVVLEVVSLSNDKLVSTITYSDFVLVAGSWWAQTATTSDSNGRETVVATQTVRQLDAAAFDQRFVAELAPREKVQFVRLPFVTVPDSEIAEKDGSAGFEDRLSLLLRASGIQKWDEAIKQLEQLEKLAIAGSGIRFIRAAVLKAARHNEDARQLYLAEADRLTAGASQDDYQLAGYVRSQSSSILDANEQLELLERLKPIYQRQPEHLRGSRVWTQERVLVLRSLGRIEELIPLQRELAASGEWDLAAQTQYANDLASTGEHAAAYAWLDREITLDVERSESEYDRLFTTWYDLLDREGQYTDLVPLTARWMETWPDSSDACRRHLGAIIQADRSEDADAKCLDWLIAGRVEGELDTPTRLRITAAWQFATGNTHNNYYHMMDPKWFKPLDETARFFVRHKHHFDIAISIIGNGIFSATHEADLLRNWLFEILLAESGTLDQQRLNSFTQWCLRGPTPEATDAGWQKIADTLFERWEQTEEFDDYNPIGNTLYVIYSRRFADRQLPFMRSRVDRAPDDRKAGLRLQLFNQILHQDWQDELAAEAFALLPLLSSDESAERRFAVLVEALHRLVDQMLVRRQNSDKANLQDKEHPEELTRIELAQKHRDFLTAAREGLVARLNSQAMRLRTVPPGDDATGPDFNTALADWLQMERMTLDIQLDRNKEAVVAECWAWLGEEPPIVGKVDEAEVEKAVDDQVDADKAVTGFPLFDAALRQRAFGVASYLAVLQSAEEGSRTRLLDYVQAGIDRDDDGSSGWKSIKYRLLIALDDPAQLERDLREWIRTDEYATPWRISLAKVIAEQGDIEQAIGLYETVERDSQLTPYDYVVLANWYLVVDRRDEYKRSTIESFKVWQEYQISNWLNQRLYPWQRSNQPLPSELDENVLFAFQALFDKSNNPGSYLYQLQQFYTACRDFRMLNMLADSVVGRTPQQVYSFLRGLGSTVLREVGDEATADEVLGRVHTLRTTLKQPGREVTPIDLRALGLLEAMVERRASEVLNQPGPHVAATLAALQRSFEYEFASGEPRQMAELLFDLGRLPHKELIDEQMRQLKALLAMEEPGTDDRLWIGWYYGSTQYGRYGLRDPGLAIVENAIREFEATHPAGWPPHVNSIFSGYVKMLTGNGRYTTAELVINRQLANPLNESQKFWLIQRMDDVFVSALSAGGEVSLGSGETLYRNLLKRLLKAAETDNHDHRHQTLQTILTFFSAAKRKHFDIAADLRTYAFTQLPTFLERQTSHYRSIVDQTAYRLKQLIDTRTGLDFLITRIENYPRRLWRSWDNPWQNFGWRLGDWRNTVGSNLGDLEPRLLKLVLEEERRDLRSRNPRTRYMYHDDYSYFWSEKRGDFARVAEEVYAEVKHSRRYVQYIAEYIYSGLASNVQAQQALTDRAIEMLLIAHGHSLLDQSGQTTLCRWLHEHNRYGESIPILEPLVKQNPHTMDYRCRLITAYHHTQRFKQRDELLADTDEYFRHGMRWIEHNIAQLADCTRRLYLYKQSLPLYGELIPLHQRTAPNRGVGNGTLSHYYQNLADVHSGLGQTQEAVDAAAGAVVSWGPRHDRRQNALNKLHQVLSQAKDLDQFVAHLDAELEATGQTSPLVRKTIGIVYGEKSEHQKAIAQLRLALELQPNDLQIHQALIREYDLIKDTANAVSAVLAQLDLDRHNLELYRDLASRLSTDAVQAERAATTIVEAAPSEAEHHAALAIHRESQERWPDAIEHWQHAARLRALEPTNLLQLAEAQIKGKQPAAARETLQKVNRKRWPSRFDNNVRSETARLKKLLQTAP